MQIGSSALLEAHGSKDGRDAGVRRLNNESINVERHRSTNDERTTAFAPWLMRYNTERRHTAIGGQPPISRVLSPTS